MQRRAAGGGIRDDCGVSLGGAPSCVPGIGEGGCLRQRYAGRAVASSQIAAYATGTPRPRKPDSSASRAHLQRLLKSVSPDDPEVRAALAELAATVEHEQLRFLEALPFGDASPRSLPRLTPARCVPGVHAIARWCDPVPLEYSIEQLTCAFAGRRGVGGLINEYARRLISQRTAGHDADPIFGFGVRSCSRGRQHAGAADRNHHPGGSRVTLAACRRRADPTTWPPSPRVRHRRGRATSPTYAGRAGGLPGLRRGDLPGARA
jgi:hypothetical protein